MRLDVCLYERGLVGSRTDAKNLILKGAVKVADKIITKPSFDVDGDASITVDTSLKRYVSRGGLKLEGALDAFSVDVAGKCAIDIGASSGGFTDCLLKHGTASVIALDSGSNQLVSALKADERVISIENFNARYMTRADLPFVPELAVMDVSFISATLIIPAVYECLSESGEFICLVKPQFEVGKANIGKGGIVKSEKARSEALASVIQFAKKVGFIHCGTVTSPIVGGDGNVEFLIHLKKTSNP